MLCPKWVGAFAMVAICTTISPAQAFDDTKYPNLKGQWNRFIVRGLGGQPSFDQTKPSGFGQEAPLTSEYKTVLEASLTDQAKGGQGNFTGSGCLAYGILDGDDAVGADLLERLGDHRADFLARCRDGRHVRDLRVVGLDTLGLLLDRVDGRLERFEVLLARGSAFPGDHRGSRKLDEDGDGVYDVLEVETRGPFKGPRAYDATGLPLHFDNESRFKERFFIDKADPNLLHDEITAIDHALTRPWTVDKRYRRSANPQPGWPEYVCAENNAQVRIGDEYYYLSAERLLMPTRKDQLPPDLRYFQQQRK